MEVLVLLGDWLCPTYPWPTSLAFLLHNSSTFPVLPDQMGFPLIIAQGRMGTAPVQTGPRTAPKGATPGPCPSTRRRSGA